MAEKKKKKMEFRYYQLPPGSPILALLGEKWVQNYGDRTADRLHFHNYMELGYCYYGAGDVVLGDDTYHFSGQQFTVIPSNFPHTTNSDPGNISRWEYLFVYLTVFSRTMHSAKSAHCSGSMKSRGFWRKQSIRRKRQKLKKS